MSKNLEEITKRLKSNGDLWLMQRIDTLEYAVPLRQYKHAEKTPADYGRRDGFAWTKDLRPFNLNLICFLTENEAKEYLIDMYVTEKLYEGGCESCGSGATPISVKITKYKFKEE